MEPEPVTRSPRPWPAAAILVLSLAAALAGAAPQEPQEPALPASSPTKFALENGMEVRLRPLQDGELATILLLLNGGSDMDPPHISDGVHLLEHLFLFVGSDTRAPYGDGTDPAWRGIRTSGVTHRDHMVLRWTCPRARLPRELEEVALRLRGLKIDPKTWSAQNAYVLEQIRELDTGDDQRYRETRGWPTRGFSKEARIREREGKFEFTSMAQIRALETALMRPDRIILSVAGRFDPVETKARIESTFGRLPRPATTFETARPRDPSPPLYGFRTFSGSGKRFEVSRLWISYRTPLPTDPDFPAFLAVVQRLWRHGWKERLWKLSWKDPLEGGDLVLEVPAWRDRWAAKVWEDTLTSVAVALEAPPDPAELFRARQYARFILGLDDWFAALGVEDLETVAYLDALAAMRGLDREAAVEAIAQVTPRDFRTAAENRLSRSLASGVARVPPPATEWIRLANGLRFGLHPLPRAERAAVVLLLPFGRRNGPSPVLARLFAHGVFPGAGNSPWSVRIGRDHTVVWWAGAWKDTEEMLMDIKKRLRGAPISEAELARERAMEAEPDPYPMYGLPPTVSALLLEGARLLDGQRADQPAPSDVPTAAAQIAAWFTPGTARIVVATPYSMRQMQEEPILADLMEDFASIPGGFRPPPLPVPTVPADGPSTDTAPEDKPFQVIPAPATTATKELAACLILARHLSGPVEWYAEKSELPDLLFDPMLDPGVIVRPVRADRKTWVPKEGDCESIRMFHFERFGESTEPSTEKKDSRVPAPLTSAVWAALLDFRGITEEQLKESMFSLTLEDLSAAARKLQEATPVTFGVKAR